MLKQRIITAAVLLSIIIFPVLMASHQIVQLIFAAMMLMAAWEWSALCGIKNTITRLIYLVVIAAVIGFFPQLMALSPAAINLLYIIVAAIWFYIGLFLLPRFRLVSDAKQSELSRSLKCVVGVLLLASSYLALSQLHLISAASVLYVFGIVWAADIGAYFAGRAFGRRKLAVHVSPGKTLEGLLGGLLAVFCLSLGGAWFFDIAMPAVIYFIGLSLFAGLISVAGDLFESVLKRQAGVKDSGWILPGHGGVLDRIDSLLAAAPVFVLGLNLPGLAEAII